MNLLRYFDSWATAELVLTALAAGACVVVMCSLLSVLVVLKRLAFIGQGVSHSAFGGIGVAAVIGAATGAAWAGQGGVVEFGVVVTFCIGAALGMASVGTAGGAGRSRPIEVDTGIGLFLVASMALGGLLVEAARALAQRLGHPVGARSWESILFGSILTAGWGDVLVAFGLLVLTVGVAWLARRPLLFWAFDETCAPAFGVPGTLMRTVLMVLLALATVTATKLAGVVLASALLVLPGATALKLSRRLWSVLALSVAVGVGGLVVGLAVSLQADLQPGPCIVLAMVAAFVAAGFWNRLGSGAAPPRSETA
ncbi:MAG: metal ABC transporter permease [Phycisphaeraceae bacterium]|nr:metal ABC transporter permease [Phycisphaeraceae bacterium]